MTARWAPNGPMNYPGPGAAFDSQSRVLRVGSFVLTLRMPRSKERKPEDPRNLRKQKMKRGVDNKAQADLIKWWDAMDMLLGTEHGRRNFAEGLRMARECEHEDAKWLCRLIPAEKPILTKEEMKHIFVAQGEERRALFFAAMVFVDDEMLLQRSAELDYHPAQAMFAARCQGCVRVEWAGKAAAQKDRIGLYELGKCYFEGDGCIKNETRALHLLKEAAELGWIPAQFYYGGKGFDESSWERYYWWGRAATSGWLDALFRLGREAVKQVKLFEMGHGTARVVFEIGAVSKGKLDSKSSTMFNYSLQELGVDREQLHAMEQAVLFHDEWCNNAKAAVECWIWTAKQLGVVKDVRILIARRLWEERAVWSEQIVLKCKGQVVSEECEPGCCWQ